MVWRLLNFCGGLGVSGELGKIDGSRGEEVGGGVRGGVVPSESKDRSGEIEGDGSVERGGEVSVEMGSEGSVERGGEVSVERGGEWGMFDTREGSAGFVVSVVGDTEEDRGENKGVSKEWGELIGSEEIGGSDGPVGLRDEGYEGEGLTRGLEGPRDMGWSARERG